MNPEVYESTYINRGQSSLVLRLDQARHLIGKDGKISGKEVWEVQKHPPFDKMHNFKALKIDITKKKIIYVLVGQVLCNFIDGQANVWFEIALSQSKEKLEIWKDLNCI